MDAKNDDRLAEIAEIWRGGWASSKYEDGLWVPIDPRGECVLTVQTMRATRAEMLAFVRAQRGSK